MHTARIRGGLLALASVAASLIAGPAGADGSTVSVDSATAGSSSIAVAGKVTFGTDATGTLVLGTDGTGDATAMAPGLDLTGISVRTEVAARRLIWTLSVGNGLPDPVGGPVPVSMGYQVPIMVGEDERWRWLGAGTAGSALANTGKWTGLCHNEASEGTSGGWACPGTLAGANTYMFSGSIGATGVSWTQPFGQMKPQIQYGSVISSSSILCGSPCSFAWPPGLATSGLAPVDKIDFMEPFMVPGKVDLGIAPTGTPEGEVDFATAATFNGTSGAFSGAFARPAETGAYTVWARTCFGKTETLTCVYGGKDITI